MLRHDAPGWLTPGSRGLQAAERRANRRLCRSRANVTAAISWSVH